MDAGAAAWSEQQQTGFVFSVFALLANELGEAEHGLEPESTEPKSTARWQHDAIVVESLAMTVSLPQQAPRGIANKRAAKTATDLARIVFTASATDAELNWFAKDS